MPGEPIVLSGLEQSLSHPALSLPVNFAIVHIPLYALARPLISFIFTAMAGRNQAGRTGGTAGLCLFQTG
jgi:hypothetical protein